MLDRINDAADRQDAAIAGNNAAAEGIEAGMAMTKEAAAELLQERTLQTVSGLRASAEEINVPDAFQSVQQAVNRLKGFEEAQLEYAPFMWVPKPEAMQSLEPAHRGGPWPTETYAVAGWNMYWRNCQLGAKTLLLFQNNSEFVEGAPHAAVVPTDVRLDKPNRLAPKQPPVLESMLQEGSENALRMSLKLILNYAKRLYPRMTELAGNARQEDFYSSLRLENRFEGAAQTAAMYYIGAILFDKALRRDPMEQLRAVTFLFEGKQQQLAESLGIEEWPIDQVSAERARKERSRKRFENLYALPYMASRQQATAFVRSYGHLYNGFRFGQIVDKEVFTPESHDVPAWQFLRPPWLFRSAEHVDAVQAAFALPSQERRRWSLGRNAGGLIGKQAVAVSAQDPAHALRAHNKIQDLVSAAYVDQLGV